MRPAIQVMQKVLQPILKNVSVSDLYKKASFSLGLKILGTFSGFLFYMLISHKYGAEGMGLFSLFIAIIGLAGVVTCFGLTSSCMRFVPQILSSNQPSDLVQLRNIQFIVVASISIVILSLFIFFAENIATHLLQDKKNTPLVYLIAFLLPIYSLYLIGIEFIRGLGQSSLFEYFRSAHLQIGGLVLLFFLGLFFNNNVLPIYIATLLYLLAFIIVWIKVQQFIKKKRISKTASK